MESLATQRRTAEYSPLEQTANSESPEEVVDRVGKLIYGICERRGIVLEEDALPLPEETRTPLSQQKFPYGIAGGLGIILAGAALPQIITYFSHLRAWNNIETIVAEAIVTAIGTTCFLAVSAAYADYMIPSDLKQ
ncbi:MAG TPA: hypothetical protein VJI15_06465 [Candidatus Nanoarchaeia archaeon]|nr:hypothetical protein [Candidatus Nanoarchaeia archaeon]